ncbi:MAG: HugZ family pyridoxamine 5'-phosphate oxidase [Pseudonocardia sp.]
MADTVEPAREPDDAELARTLAAARTTAMLATQSVQRPGFPFGSVVTYAADPAGRPLMWLSDLAEHSRNLAADPRASLLVVDERPGDPLAHARATLVGEVTVLHGAGRAAAVETYRAVHSAVQDFHDFRMYRLDVAAVRFVGGFARMSWVDGDGYVAAEPDPLHPYRDGIVEHMNDDHADALVTFCRAFGGQPATASARMTGVDRYGFGIDARTGDGARVDVRIAFDEPVATSDEVRRAMIALLGRARAAQA